MIPLQELEKSKHIVIESHKNNFPQASVLYSLMLLKHKKVSLFAKEEEKQYAFLPWYEKLRRNEPASADLKISADMNILELYTFLQKHEIKINAKMATALYAGFLKRYDNFLSPDCNGMLFAVLSELINLGADHQLCVNELTRKVLLSSVRLKSIIFKKVLLKKNARLATVRLCEEDFASSGATWSDVYDIAKELLNLVHVQEVEVTKSDEKDKIIKLSKEV
ncbi:MULTISPECIES: hypothetical protein [Sulfurimonas]|uniref:DHH family phosphoesterase n=1 Tax=Sulfurimonas TaxID=202746 RepID=UPI001265402C|nr:hypothetical protein [Sulfurimonas indica]